MLAFAPVTVGVVAWVLVVWVVGVVCEVGDVWRDPVVVDVVEAVVVEADVLEPPPVCTCIVHAMTTVPTRESAAPSTSDVARRLVMSTPTIGNWNLPDLIYSVTIVDDVG